MPRKAPSIDVDRLALDLYAAVLDGDDLAEPLTAFTRALGAQSGFIARVVFDSELVFPPRFVQHGYDPMAMDAYQAHWIQHDPWMIAGRDQSPGVLNFGRLIPSEEVTRTAFWNDFAGRQENKPFHSIAVSIALNDEATGILAVQRSRHQDPFGPDEEALLSRMYPHIRRALAADARIISAALRIQAADVVLETDGLGMAIVTLGGRLAYANAAMRSIAERRDGLELVRQGLIATERQAQTLLEPALRHAVAVAAGQVKIDGNIGGVIVPRPSGATPWQVQVLPTPPGGRGALTSHAGAIILVTDPDARRGPNEKQLENLLGLTPSESALAVALVAGRTLAEHAAKHRASVETMRTHLANIRRKTGCRRQAELVSFVMRLGA